MSDLDWDIHRSEDDVAVLLGVLATAYDELSDAFVRDLERRLRVEFFCRGRHGWTTSNGRDPLGWRSSHEFRYSRQERKRGQRDENPGRSRKRPPR